LKINLWNNSNQLSFQPTIFLPGSGRSGDFLDFEPGLKGMIAKDNFIALFMKRLEKLEIWCYFDIRSFKRNRSILVIRISEDFFRVIENGFEKNEFELNKEWMKKLWKTLLKREFPRSNKIRLYDMGVYEVESLEKRKKI